MSLIATKTIVALFVNFLFAVGVILTVIGFVGGLRTAANLVVFDEYPLSAYENDCQYLKTRPVTAPGETESTDAAMNREQEQKDCEDALVTRRKVKLVTDVTNSIGLLASGIVLYLLFNPKSKVASSLTV
jgi:hypothetical protein